MLSFPEIKENDVFIYKFLHPVHTHSHVNLLISTHELLYASLDIILTSSIHSGTTSLIHFYKYNHFTCKIIQV